MHSPNEDLGCELTSQIEVLFAEMTEIAAAAVCRQYDSRWWRAVNLMCVDKLRNPRMRPVSVDFGTVLCSLPKICVDRTDFTDGGFIGS